MKIIRNILEYGKPRSSFIYPEKLKYPLGTESSLLLSSLVRVRRAGGRRASPISRTLSLNPQEILPCAQEKSSNSREGILKL